MEEVKIVMNKSDLDKIAGYLVNKPWVEVQQLIDIIRNCKILEGNEPAVSIAPVKEA